MSLESYRDVPFGLTETVTGIEYEVCGPAVWRCADVGGSTALVCERKVVCLRSNEVTGLLSDGSVAVLQGARMNNRNNGRHVYAEDVSSSSRGRCPFSGLPASAGSFALSVASVAFAIASSFSSICNTLNWLQGAKQT